MTSIARWLAQDPVSHASEPLLARSHTANSDEDDDFSLYMQALETARFRLAKRLGDKGAALHAATASPRRRPSAHHSRFARTWHLGDWAEDALMRAIDAAPHLACQRIDAEDGGSVGSADFDASLDRRWAERALGGKRPDLLVRQSDAVLGAIEVRASAHHLARYRAAGAKKAEGMAARSLSFTVKLEDLAGIYRWIVTHRRPQTHVQVFLDGAYAINALRLFETLAFAQTLPRLRAHGRNQNKPTFHIPIEEGVEIGLFQPEPELGAEASIDETGRASATLSPLGGTLRLNAAALREEMMPHAPAMPLDA